MSSELWGFEEYLFDLIWSRRWLREYGILIWLVTCWVTVSFDDRRGLLADAFPALGNSLAWPVHSRQSMFHEDKALFMSEPVVPEAVVLKTFQ